MSHITRTIPTAAKARAAIRSSAPILDASPAEPRPLCAFHAPIGFGSTIRVAHDFSLTFPLTGLVLAFAAGTAIVLDAPETWPAAAEMAITHRRGASVEKPELVALPAERVDPAQIVLGGFDLDASGAVLAGSFGDANLLDGSSPAVGLGQSSEENSIVARLADVFVTRQRNGFDDTTDRDLVREGFSEAEILAHYDAATARAAAQLRHTDVAASRTTYDRQARVMLGAVAIAGRLDPNTVNTDLHQAGLSTREIGNLFDDIIGESLKLVREGHAALAGAHTGQAA